MVKTPIIRYVDASKPLHDLPVIPFIIIWYKQNNKFTDVLISIN